MRGLGTYFSVVLWAGVLTGCASLIYNEPINRPLVAPAGAASNFESELPGSGDDLLVGLAFSGGGMRAAAFSYGVLSELDQVQVGSKTAPTRLIERVDFVSGVSGGAVTAAYFGLKGRTGLAEFHERFLMRNAEESFASIVSPINIARAYEGGVNDSRQFPRWLDDNLFHGATFRDLEREDGPRVWVNASDIYNRTPFVFDDVTFNAICSDLASYPVSQAVAASAAMPVIFAPVVLQSFPDRCTAKVPDWIASVRDNGAAPPMLKEFANAIFRYRDGSVPYIKLLDGGLVDNYGLSGFTIARLSAHTPYGPLTPVQATKMRRVLFFVIDGGVGPSGDWARTVEGPTAPEIVVAAANTAIDSSVRASYTAFDRTMSEWRDVLIHWRCSLTAADRRKYNVPQSWNCRDLKFFVGRVNFEALGKQRAEELNAVPTRFNLEPEVVERVVAAGRDALRANATFKAFLSTP